MSGNRTRTVKLLNPYDMEVMELVNNSFTIPKTVKLFTCYSPNNEPFTVTQGFDTFTFTNSYQTHSKIKSEGLNAITLATTTTLKLILFK